MEWHYILTVQDADSGARVATTTGIITPAPGATRLQVYQHLLADMHERGGPAGGIVKFFSLEPNRLQPKEGR